VSADRITLEQCGQVGRLRALPSGSYALEYHDATHLRKDEWVRLAMVDVWPSLINLGNETLNLGDENVNLGDENVEQF
jgi:hypothetical protein